MSRMMSVATACLAAAILGGCNLPAPGTSRTLGDVEYAAAFAAAREVMIQDGFSIAAADPDTGAIEARPLLVEARGERILGGSPARHLAKMSLQRKGGQVVARASVALQREGSAVQIARAPAVENYDSVPNRTPAQDLAATTPEQNEDWATERYDHAVERRLLDELYQALHPAEE